MSDYSDWDVWKEVELYKEAEYLSDQTEYRTDTLVKVFKHLFEKAKSAGLEGCFLRFSSTMEPYEDYLGPVKVTVVGYKKLTPKDQQIREKEKSIQALAEEMGVTYYEAKVVFDLRKSGKLK